MFAAATLHFVGVSFETDHARPKRLAAVLARVLLQPPYDEYRGYIPESLGQLAMRIPGTYGYKLNLNAGEDPKALIRELG